MLKTKRQCLSIKFLKRILCSAIASMVLVGISTPLALAQMPALLPMKDKVPPTKATPVDGVYVISTLKKRIKIDRGRGYMIDPWTQALFWEVKTDMVTLKNFRRTGVGTYEADDLPMTAKVKFTMGPQGVLNGVVKGVKYKLIPISAANTTSFTEELLAVRKQGAVKPRPGPKPRPIPEPVASAPAKQYLIYVRNAWCTGKKSWTVGTMSGAISLRINSPDGGEIRTSKFTVKGKCKKKNYKKQTYSYSRTDSKLLSIKTTDLKQFNNLRIMGNYGAGGIATRVNLTTTNADRALQRLKNMGRPMKVDETLDTHIAIHGGAEPDLYLNIRIKRVK